MVERRSGSPMSKMSRSLVVVALLAWAPPFAEAAPPPALACSDATASWSLALDARRAQLSFPDQPDVLLQGRFSSIDVQKAHAWRGRASNRGAGEVVAFVSEAACRLGVGDDAHPFAIRLSLPDGRFLAGCCVLAAEAAAGATPAPRPTPSTAPRTPPTPAPSSGDWTASLVTFFPAIKACVRERMQTEAVVYAAVGPDKVVHLVLRLPGERYADCDLPPGRGRAKVKTRRPGTALASEELAAVLTLLPSEAPSEGCYRSQSALDELGNPFGWISIKGC
jgi:hypothetical protein